MPLQIFNEDWKKQSDLPAKVVDEKVQVRRKMYSPASRPVFNHRAIANTAISWHAVPTVLNIMVRFSRASIRSSYRSDIQREIGRLNSVAES